MTKGNGKSKVASINIDHELPASDGQENPSAAETASAESQAAQTGAPEEEIARLKQENATYLDRLARVQAEFDNYRKRSVKEQQDYRDYALAEALKLFLPILDSLDRALKTQSSSAEDFRAGVDLIDRQFHDVLSKLGVEPLEALGQLFDPNLHQAIQTVETEEVPDNHVVDELQRGYKIKDRLLRPAMVRVAQNPNK